MGVIRKRVAMLLSAFAAAAMSSTAFAGSNNLRAEILGFNADCLKLRTYSNQCAWGAVANAYFKTHSVPVTGKLKGLLRLYAQMAPTCQSMKPSSSDGSLGNAEVTLYNKYVELACQWNGSTTVVNAKVIVSVPLISHQMPTNISCGGCTRIAGGFREVQPYSPSPGFGEYGVFTVDGWVQVQRWAKNQTAFAAHRSDDLAMYHKLAAELGLPS